MTSDLDAWLRNWLNGEEPVYERSECNIAILEAYRQAVENTETECFRMKQALLETMKVVDEEIHQLETLGLSPSSDCHELIESAWLLQTDPLTLHTGYSERINELKALNDELYIQREENRRLQESIEHLRRLTAEYNNTELKDKQHSYSDRIAILQAKTKEYQKRSTADHNVIFKKVLELHERHTELSRLNKELDKFAHLPPNIPEALSLIAMAEADLANLEEGRKEGGRVP